jgi:hypothetical protein
MTRLNKMDKGNIQSTHVAKLVSAFHSACNPVNVIESFRNAGIVLHLESTGVAVCSVDKYQCRCLLQHFEAPIAAIEVRQHKGDADEIDDITEPLVRSSSKSSSKRLHRCWERTSGEIQLNMHSHPFVVLSRYLAFFCANQVHRTPLKS